MLIWPTHSCSWFFLRVKLDIHLSHIFLFVFVCLGWTVFASVYRIFVLWNCIIRTEWCGGWELGICTSVAPIVQLYRFILTIP